MSELQEWKVEAPWIHINSSLGEGPFFEEATKTIRFVDIPQQKLHTLSLAEGLSSLHTLEFDVPVTVTCDIEGVDPQDKILVGLKYGLATVDRKTGAYEMISEFNAERDPRLRSNDGAADSRGNFWIGTMTDKGFDLQPEGKLTFKLWDAHHLPRRVHRDSVVDSSRLSLSFPAWW
jgi:sugar lactone lactonase YvrE